MTDTKQGRPRKQLLPLLCALGALCLAIADFAWYFSLHAADPLASALATVGGCLILVFLFLLSYWFAARPSKAAHVFAVGLWIIIGALAFFMLSGVIRDFEIRRVTGDTWITVGILAALIPAAFFHRIRAAHRRKAFRRRASGLAEGVITQLIGETRLDRDGEPVTSYHALVDYEVDGAAYETRADIYKFTLRLLGRDRLAGRKIPVHYDPADPAAAYTERINRHFLDGLSDEPAPAGGAESDPPAATCPPENVSTYETVPTEKGGKKDEQPERTEPE